jgi:hypothetical protein
VAKVGHSSVIRYQLVPVLYHDQAGVPWAVRGRHRRDDLARLGAEQRADDEIARPEV